MAGVEACGLMLWQPVLEPAQITQDGKLIMNRNSWVHSSGGGGVWEGAISKCQGHREQEIELAAWNYLHPLFLKKKKNHLFERQEKGERENEFSTCWFTSQKTIPARSGSD